MSVISNVATTRPDSGGLAQPRTPANSMVTSGWPRHDPDSNPQGIRMPRLHARCGTRRPLIVDLGLAR